MIHKQCLLTPFYQGEYTIVSLLDTRVLLPKEINYKTLNPISTAKLSWDSYFLDEVVLKGTISHQKRTMGRLSYSSTKFGFVK